MKKRVARIIVYIIALALLGYILFKPYLGAWRYLKSFLGTPLSSENQYMYINFICHTLAVIACFCVLGFAVLKNEKVAFAFSVALFIVSLIFPIYSTVYEYLNVYIPMGMWGYFFFTPIHALICIFALIGLILSIIIKKEGTNE